MDEIYLYDASGNRLKNSENEYISANKLFPNLETKSMSQWMNSFTAIEYCDNLDDLSYNKDYVLKDVSEGFSDLPMDSIEKLYLLLFAIGIIFLIFKSF
jgi:hypothetical protein